jgi:hypothetical protein
MAITTRINSKLVRYEGPESVAYSHWCPACNHVHTYRVQGAGPNWNFDGNVDSPTFTPSYREFYPAQGDAPETTICHTFLTAGVIQFLGDCPNEYANTNVSLPDIPDDYGFGNVRFADLPTVG